MLVSPSLGPGQTERGLGKGKPNYDRKVPCGSARFQGSVRFQGGSVIPSSGVITLFHDIRHVRENGGRVNVGAWTRHGTMVRSTCARLRLIISFELHST